MVRRRSGPRIRAARRHVRRAAREAVQPERLQQRIAAVDDVGGREPDDGERLEAVA
jgi:hypothetical protein